MRKVIDNGKIQKWFIVFCIIVAIGCTILGKITNEGELYFRTIMFCFLAMYGGAGYSIWKQKFSKKDGQSNIFG